MATACFAADDAGQARLLLFVDTTASLNAGQSDATASLARELLHKGREYDSVAVYPVGSADEAPPAVLDEPVKERVNDRRRQLQRWDILLDAGLGKHKNDAHTCLLDSVEFASKQLATLHLSQDSHVDLVFITDMIEDCPSNPLKVPIHLDKPSIKPEIELARQFPTGRIKLTNTRAYVVVPPDSKAHPRGPRMDDLEQFWRTFFSRCGIQPTDVTISLSRVPPDLEETD